MKVSKEDVDRFTRELVDKGKIIEAGWAGLRLRAIQPDASDVQLTEMRMAFFAGAQHLFGTIMTILTQAASRPRKTCAGSMP